MFGYPVTQRPAPSAQRVLSDCEWTERGYLDVDQKHVDLIRDAALRIEGQDLQMAYELMTLAHAGRPSGRFILAKMQQYERRLQNAKLKQEKEVTRQRKEIVRHKRAMKELVSCGKLAVIPAGFRCYTKTKITGKLGIRQASLPFDSGFFPPDAVANLLEGNTVNLQYPDPGHVTHQVCQKWENFKSEELGLGLRFKTSTYEEIDEAVKTKDQKGINRYLDATFGYYTYDKKNEYILAHFNWHKFSDESYNKGTVDPKENIQKINEMLNMRIQRMFDLCANAERILFVTAETQGYNYMMIDDKVHHLNDFSRLKKTVEAVFDGKASLVSLSEIEEPDKLRAILG